MDIPRLVGLRHALHRKPELSGSERETAATLAAFLVESAPDQVVTGLGGHGLAVVYNGSAPGPSLLIRSELDALPIAEQPRHDHGSERPGWGHLCGHDGHSTILAGLGLALGRKRPAKGRVILMFQPSEENGAGAAAVLADPAFAPLRPDLAVSLHNMPGLPLGSWALVEGAANCASVGMRVVLTGRESHASQPELGKSPGPAMARLIAALAKLGKGGPLAPDYRLVTVTHATLGEPAFGISPGHGEVWATLRCVSDGPMAALRAEAEALARSKARGLGVAITWHDDFSACVNHPVATKLLLGALLASGLPETRYDFPMRGSEDFGRFGQVCPSAMFLLGSGEKHPALHNPDYDFPDTLITPAVGVFQRVIGDYLG
ncbi:amidohydrolase [Neogemmobacter tilapiae]|uniref:Peptidase M20 n=1 Tax=Neogemmobacter tilapiae TaxID=875041 RepID=A0A918WHJ1_9RHOB|nr:amidohydrolase [Gemmobacter tilapiae]GHC48238.1 peptidase M20 [Gemmobacter tilapiae]